MRRIAVAVFVAGIGTAAADPPAASTDPTPPGALFTAAPLLTPPTRDVKVVPSLRLEAVRVAGERFEGDWRYPEPGTLGGIQGGDWFFGVGHYRPRTTRSAALHGGSIAATLLGEILLEADSPLAAAGMLVGGATLDAAAADADRDAEARR
jgi:hypothetical protein